MQPDTAIKRRPGRPFGSCKPQPPTTTARMSDALRIWRVDLDQPDAVRGVLRIAGFGLVEIAALSDFAVAAARKRHPGRR